MKRRHNIYRKTVFLALVIGILISTLLSCGLDTETGDRTTSLNENKSLSVWEQDNKDSVGVFLTPDLEALSVDSGFNISSCYITNKTVAMNHYYIDENHVLWGCGSNDCGQLGLKKNSDIHNLEAFYGDYVKIAEDVVHVDCSANSYFMIYLTKQGDLYGVGQNRMGVLLNEVSENDELNPWLNVICEPKLLLEDVKYARAGMESITVLKENGDVYWWGKVVGGYSSDSEIESMISIQPQLMLQNAKYVSSGDWTAAAITKDNELYLWGCNWCGQCGIESSENYVYEAQKVLDHVAMVWPECMVFNSPQDYIEQYAEWSDPYQYENTFVRMENGEFRACGRNIGKQEKEIFPVEDWDSKENIRYSTEFLPITVKE